MASWCADNLWDAKAWNEHKLGLTVSSDEAAKLFDCSLRQLVSWQDCQQMGGLDKTLKHMREAEPEFLMGRCFSLGLNALGTGHSIWVDPTYRTELEALVADARRRGNSREQRHARAVQLFAQGEMQSATIEWEKIMAEHPNDLLAIKFAHDAYFFMGDNRGKRDSVANVIDKWDKSAPCYSYLHGMYAFGLEECGQYPEAERHARLGLQLQPQDCWSTHALAHCLEMASNFEEGIRFMEGTRTDWTVCSFLACHNFWHTALFYIEKGDYESALSIFDSEITDRGNHSGSMLDMVDAASLLARLEMEGHLGREAGHERWAALLPRVDAHLDDHTLVFNDAHIAMVLGRLADRELIGRHRDSLAKFVGDAMGGDNWRLSRDFGEQICDAIVAFNSEQYDRAFDQLYQVRTQIYRIGGSNAQRDVFTQILINAGIRSGDKGRLQKTLEVIQEREKYKPKSAVAQRLLQRHKETTEH